VDAALAAGYSIFTYDRLGVGQSDKPDAYDVVQTPAQVEILRVLTVMAKAGTLVSSATTTSPCGPGADLKEYKPNKIVHVGHSFGSVATAFFLNENGQLSDGAILTGFVVTEKVFINNQATHGWELARESDPKRWGDRGSGYIIPGTKYDLLQFFFSQASLDLPLLDYAWSLAQPNTVSEQKLLPLFATNPPSQTFKAPLQVCDLHFVLLARAEWVSFF